MSELSDSIAETIRKRTASAAFGTYLFFWTALHWQGFYTTLFTSEELIYERYGLLKNEYVGQHFFGWHGLTSILGYLFPVLLTAVFIWILPKYLLIHAYREEQRHKVAKRRVKLEEEATLQTKKKEVAKKTKETLEAEIEASVTKKAAAATDPTILFDQEFEEFRTSQDYSKFGQILSAIYKHNGNTQVINSFGTIQFRLTPQALKMADVKGLVVISDKGNTIKLTEKGKYFASRYDEF